MLRIIQVGLGEIGRAVVQSLLQRFARHAGRRSDPKLAGKICVNGPTSPLPLSIVPTIAEALRDPPKPDVAIVTTGSRLDKVADTFFD